MKPRLASASRESSCVSLPPSAGITGVRATTPSCYRIRDTEAEQLWSGHCPVLVGSTCPWPWPASHAVGVMATVSQWAELSRCRGWRAASTLHLSVYTSCPSSWVWPSQGCGGVWPRLCLGAHSVPSRDACVLGRLSTWTAGFRHLPIFLTALFSVLEVEPEASYMLEKPCAAVRSPFCFIFHSASLSCPDWLRLAVFLPRPLEE